MSEFYSEKIKEARGKPAKSEKGLGQNFHPRKFLKMKF
tara:strand:+ start:273 stop:386 length:114 start_codon:yes stop_codon:yes gene_type:complete